MANRMASRVAGIGPIWFERRQMGFRNPLGTSDYMYQQIYSNIIPCNSWDHTSNNTNTSMHGGVFSLEFSPEGSLLVAACEKRSVLVFDPLTHKRIHTVENAHSDCVNCVKFLDSRSFATCSDDFTVALWDARNLNQKVRTLKGHNNWVKNIEYSPQDGLLVTSGFDGSILTWEMNKYLEKESDFTKVFATNGLMRTRLTPDASKMVICTTSGYLIVIHNLDLKALSQDLDGFKPNMYRLMQLSQTMLPIASEFTHLFRGQGKRNRVEFITDFPEDDDAEVVSSLQIHPDGHSAISRNVSSDEQSEWSCIHNIEERLSSDESDYGDDDDDEDCNEGGRTVSWPGSLSSISTTPSYIIQHTVVQNENNRPTTSRTEAGSSSNREHRDLSVSPSDVWEALVAIQDARIRRERDRVTSDLVGRNMFRRTAADAGVQVRRPSSGTDNRIFVTRILPNANSTADNGETVRTAVNNPSNIQRRNVSVSTMEVNLPSSSNEEASTSSSSGGNDSSRRVYRIKIPLRQRFCSLYRRSLVGQYDRTSVLRKPMYNLYGNFRFKRLNRNTQLNTNYEMNETRRIQEELERNNFSPQLNVTAGNDVREQPDGSGIRTQEGHRSILRRRIDSVLRSGLPRIVRSPASETEPSSSSGNPSQAIPSPINRALNSLRQDINSIENNLNSFRETVNNLEGTINSALQVLRRSENILQTINNLNDNENTTVNSNNNSNSNNNDGISNTNNPVNEENSENRDANEEEVANEEETDRESIRSRNERSEASERTCSPTSRVSMPSTSSSSARPTSPPTSSPAQTSNERTILMGVFRAGNEDGVRGTSMRRHNVAALTVSSSNQRITDTLIGGLNLIRNRTSGNRRSGGNFSVSYPSAPVNKKIHQNVNKLTHYTEEPNLGRGFIKELCISPDGRVICSPFGNGIRLLSFSPTVQDISHCYPQTPPIRLHELSLNMAHTDIVVSTKFSPFHNLLVSGCLSGKIVYYQPLL